VRRFLVGQKPSSIHEQCGDFLEGFAEKGYEADTPCQSAYKAALSATDVKIAMNVASKMNDEGDTIIPPEFLLESRLVTQDTQPVLLLILILLSPGI
jgi:hypothetical protein